jgi:hypothetical protein
MISNKKSIYSETFNTLRINNSFDNGVVTVPEKPSKLYITLFIGGFVILNALVISLLSTL